MSACATGWCSRRMTAFGTTRWNWARCCMQRCAHSCCGKGVARGGKRRDHRERIARGIARVNEAPRAVRGPHCAQQQGRYVVSARQKRGFVTGAPRHLLLKNLLHHCEHREAVSLVNRRRARPTHRTRPKRSRWRAGRAATRIYDDRKRGVLRQALLNSPRCIAAAMTLRTSAGSKLGDGRYSARLATVAPSRLDDLAQFVADLQSSIGRVRRLANQQPDVGGV